MNFEAFHIILVLAFVPVVVIAAVRPKLLVYSYLGILIFFSNPVWGVAEGVDLFNIYSRGKGQLTVSFLNLCLIGMAAFSLVRWPVSKASRGTFSIGKYFLAFDLLFLIYVGYGILLQVPLEYILSAKGVINLVNMTLIAFIVHRAFSTPEDGEQLTRFVILAVLLRGLYGLVRFTFFGGDPANYYANYQHLEGIRITFFDINDSLFACMGAVLAAWKLNKKRARIAQHLKLLYLVTIAVALAVIIFSYRRTAWFGLMLAGLVIVWMLPRHRRLLALVVFGSVGTFIFGVVAIRRFQKVPHDSGILESLFPDIFGSAERSGIAHGRFSELSAAFDTVKEHLIFGVGPWGQFEGGFRDFMHSGFLHVWLKTGLVGLAIFAAMLAAAMIFMYRHRRDIPIEHRGLLAAGVAGLLFLTPSLLFGTPIIEYRTMQALGLILALPYVAYVVSRDVGDGKAAVNTRRPLVGDAIKPRPAIHFAGHSDRLSRICASDRVAGCRDADQNNRPTREKPLTAPR